MVASNVEGTHSLESRAMHNYVLTTIMCVSADCGLPRLPEGLGPDSVIDAFVRQECAIMLHRHTFSIFVGAGNECLRNVSTNPVHAEFGRQHNLTVSSRGDLSELGFRKFFLSALYDKKLLGLIESFLVTQLNVLPDYSVTVDLE